MWLSTLADISPVGIFRTDTDGRCLHVNRRWCEITGLSVDEALGEGWVAALHPDDAARVFRIWTRAVERSRPFHAQYRFKTPAGRVTWVFGSAKAVRDESGTLLGYIGTITDVSRMKEDFESLKQTREQTRSIIQHMPLLLEAYDANGLICVWNREAERVTGYGAAEMIGNREALERLYPDPLYRASLKELWRKQVDDYENWEWEITARDGETKTVSWSNISGRFPVPGWSSWRIGVDITTHRRLELNLRERLKELNCLYKISTLVNLPGMRMDDLLPQAVALIPPSWQFPEITCARIQFHEQVYTAGPFRSTPWQLTSSISVRGQAVGRVDVCYLEQRQGLHEGPFLLEERLLLNEIANQIAHFAEARQAAVDQVLLGELSAKTEELEQFSYTVSHDLKNPLTAIGGFAQLLEKQIDQGDLEKAAVAAERIVEISRRMERRIEEILKLAQLGRIADLAGDVSVQQLATEVLELVRERLRGVAVILEIPPDFPPLSGDSERLREVLENLIDNALKYMGDQPIPEIRIGVRGDGPTPVFYVRDNGIGIDPRHFRTVFELFRQLDSESTGDGTGLAIVKRIIEAHGGRIWVESEGLGKGSCFCFTLGTSNL